MLCVQIRRSSLSKGRALLIARAKTRRLSFQLGARLKSRIYGFGYAICVLPELWSRPSPGPPG
eukprot:1325394-Rhodomonas_salina.1